MSGCVLTVTKQLGKLVLTLDDNDLFISEQNICNG